MFPYIVPPCVSLCFQLVSTSHPDLSLPYYTSLYLTFFTSIHLLISHLSPVPPIFLSVRLDFPRTPFGLTFHLIIPVPTRIVFKTKPCIHSSSESTLLFSALLAVIIMVVLHDYCLTLFFYLLSPTLPTLVDLIFILSILSRDVILSYPSLHDHYLTPFIFLSRY